MTIKSEVSASATNTDEGDAKLEESAESAITAPPPVMFKKRKSKK